MDNNPISTIPDWICDLPALKNLSFNGCNISKLPENLDGLKNLRSLQLSGCPIEKKEMERVRAVLVKTAIVF
jgi:Leucine-rich repeat (LRR) protein